MNPFRELSGCDFHVRNVTSKKETWHKGTIVNNLHTGRSNHLLHIVTEGCRDYTWNGQSINIVEGTVLFISAGTRYATTATMNTSGIGIAFELVTNVIIPTGVFTQWKDENGDYLRLFSAFHDSYITSVNDILRRKSLLFRILDKMNRQQSAAIQLNEAIMPALRYMSMNYHQNITVATYARLCGLSESYFRREFLRYTGMTPIEYRNFLRFQAARSLQKEGYTTEEIATMTGFCDVSYFRKMYKKHTGISFSRYARMEVV